MVPTYGLTHLNLAVADFGTCACDSMSRFSVCVSTGSAAMGSTCTLGHLVGTTSSLSLRTRRRPAWQGGVAHFGFRLLKPEDIDDAVVEVERAGTDACSVGAEFAPRLPIRLRCRSGWLRNRDLVRVSDGSGRLGC